MEALIVFYLIFNIKPPNYHVKWHFSPIHLNIYFKIYFVIQRITVSNKSPIIY